jgi:predicted ATPase
MRSTHVIRTPDQRLRIFVSSTLQELAAERLATRTALERLHLAPVMFELGARPHPPRDLYRAYLEQSDVFLGLYWERYGWVAPDETVSGLEDEYNLCPPDLPRLLYIKSPANNRDPELALLLERIREDDRAAYRYFETAKELARLVEADLATLLAERFEQSRAVLAADVASETDRVVEPVRLPVQLTDLIGRDGDLGAIQRMLESGERLVTLLGPGGIGKSRLAIAAARAAAPSFADGAVFVDLSAVHDTERVPNTIAQALGVRDTGDAPIMEKLVTAFSERHLLLVLDNFEQVLGAAPALTALLAAAPGVAMLVTSRALLRVSAEQSFEVGPLAERSSVNLFAERAHAVKPDFEVTSENADVVAGVCAAVDGMPLAIELAAARIRVLSLAELLDRLDRRLSVLVGGSRDMPERQQTLRRTIEWSTQLLDDGQRRLLSRLGVFEGGFTLEAAEFVGNDGGQDNDGGRDADLGRDADGGDILTDLAALVDSSLISQHDRDGLSRFSMQAIVREYAREQLRDDGGLPRAREVHARFFLGLADSVESGLKGARQRDLMQRLGDERDNLRAAERFLLGSRDWDRAAHLAFRLYLYWWVSGLLGEVRTWMDEPLESGDQLGDHTRAIALYFTRTIRFWRDPDGSVAADLAESAELFHRAGDPDGEGLTLISLALALLAGEKPDPERADEVMETSLRLFRGSGSVWGESMALVLLGRVALRQQKVQEAQHRFEESLALTRQASDAVGERIASYHLGWARLLLGAVDDARADFALSVALSASLGHIEGIAFGLEGMVAVAALAGDAERAGRLAGAAHGLRERSGTHNGPTFTFHQAYIDQLVAGGAGEHVAAAVAAGRELTIEQAVAEALAERPDD